MTEKEILQWIKTNLSPVIDKALHDSTGGNLFSADLLAAMVMREVNFLIARNHTKPFSVVCELMKGDYGQRALEKEKCYHGFGFWQIDIGSFPDFVNSGDWQDPYKCCMKAIEVLNGKRLYIASHYSPIEPDLLQRAAIAAYNTGEGNVVKSLKNGKDVDSTTHQKNYSKEVFRYRDIYNTLP